MTKPLTWLCLFLALGSGLFLYQTKHRAQLLDREIAQVMRAADAARARSGVLQAEYQLLSDPQRLASLTTSHLSLRPTAPGQFSTWTDLERRLPPVGPPPVDPSPSGLPAIMDAPSESEFASVDDLPVPPIPPPVMPVVLAQAAPPAPLPPVRPTPPASAALVMVAARPAPIPPRAAPARIAALPNPVVNAVISSVMASAPRRMALATTAPAYHAPAYAAYAAPSTYGAPPAQSVGSSLGMARFHLPSPIGTANAASFSSGGGAQ